MEHVLTGTTMQVLTMQMGQGESIYTESGGMAWMSDTFDMQTNMEGGVLTAGKRVLTGESLFMTTFTCEGPGRQRAAFAAPYPGKIIPMDLTQLGGELLCQKDSFLCAARGVSIGIAFTKRLGAGLFGGEGFILQRLNGDGLAFVHAGGTLCQRRLAAGETLRVDTGCIVAFQKTVSYDIKFVGGFKNTLFGGEGLFFATLTGPGEIWLPSLPFSRLADRVHAATSRPGRGRKVGEGSILGGLGRVIGGD